MNISKLFPYAASALLQASAAAALTLLCSQAQAGPLTGQTLAASGDLFSGTAVVGSGVEFSFINFFLADFSEDGQLDLRTNGVFGAISFDGTDSATFSDVNGAIPDIVGVRLISKTAGVRGFAQSNISFTANSITLALADTGWGSTDDAQLQIDFAPSAGSTVPEPSSLALVVFALAAQVAYARRRTSPQN